MTLLLRYGSRYCTLDWDCSLYISGCGGAKIAKLLSKHFFLSRIPLTKPLNHHDSDNLLHGRPSSLRPHKRCKLHLYTIVDVTYGWLDQIFRVGYVDSLPRDAIRLLMTGNTSMIVKAMPSYAANHHNHVPINDLVVIYIPFTMYPTADLLRSSIKAIA